MRFVGIKINTKTKTRRKQKVKKNTAIKSPFIIILFTIRLFFKQIKTRHCHFGPIERFVCLFVFNFHSLFFFEKLLPNEQRRSHATFNIFINFQNTISRWQKGRTRKEEIRTKMQLAFSQIIASAK